MFQVYKRDKAYDYLQYDTACGWTYKRATEAEVNTLKDFLNE